MDRIGLVKHWFLGPPIRGPWALAGAVTAVAIPTLIRAAFPGELSGSAFIPFVSFVLLSAVLLGWRYAIVVAVASVVVGDLVVFGPNREMIDQVNEIAAIAIFLASSALIIAFVELNRSVIGHFVMLSDPDASFDGVVFSLEDGQAWASHYGIDVPVRLGPRDHVAEMMQDFIAQVELGKRLTGEPAE